MELLQRWEVVALADELRKQVPFFAICGRRSWSRASFVYMSEFADKHVPGLAIVRRRRTQHTL